MCRDAADQLPVASSRQQALKCSRCSNSAHLLLISVVKCIDAGGGVVWCDANGKRCSWSSVCLEQQVRARVACCVASATGTRASSAGA